MMLWSSWKVAGVGLLAAGTLAAGTASVLVAQQVAGPAPAAKPAATGPAPASDTYPDAQLVPYGPYVKTRPNAAPLDAGQLPGAPAPGAVVPPPTPKPTDEELIARPPAPLPPADAPLADLLRERLGKAQARYEAQNAFYNEGRITIDRLIDAARQVMEAELALADDPGRRRASVQTYVDRLQRIHDRESRELEVGRVTAADLAEAADKLIEARILLAREGQPPASAPASAKPASASPKVAELRQARIELARSLLLEAERLYPAEMSGEDYLAAVRQYYGTILTPAASAEIRAITLQAQVESGRWGWRPSRIWPRRGRRSPPTSPG